MNKKIKSYFEGLGIKVQNNVGYGNLKGFEVNIAYAALDNVAPLKMHVSFYASDETKRLITNDLRNLKLKFFTYATDLYGITLGFNGLTYKTLINKMPEMLDKIFDVFAKNEVKGLGYCPVCGEELPEDSKKYLIDWSSITIDSNCVGNLNQVIEAENKDFNEAPNNYLKGTFGALLGALVGAIAFFILFYLGYVSAITSLIAILLGTYLYKKLGGKPNVVMVVIVSITSIASMLLTVWGLYVLISQVLVIEYGFTSTGIQAFKDMMTISDFSSEFLYNFGMTVLFTVLGVVFQISQLFKSVKRQGAIK